MKVTKSVISLLSYYGWMKFSIIYEEAWTSVMESLTEQAGKKNKMKINYKKAVIDRHKCCEYSMDCCRSGYWYTVLHI